MIPFVVGFEFGFVCCIFTIQTNRGEIFGESEAPLISLLISFAATMVRVSVLNDALKSMYNAEKRGYIGEFEYVDDHRSGKIVVELNGRLNKCGVISPRFDVGVKEIEGWTARLLPSRQFGYIVLTTSAGIMDHEVARRKNVISSRCSILCLYAIYFSVC
ncbi:putative ribosomal protein S8 [Rosa chinensis]|uniref:Putative ribosomal protein S8 n=1 Tax=Rosa chinensis TaxID=74649 RepID=A0A2P6QGC3_ROSCH|nr:putative ribosomal protein S8 [Rosa chinensis]